MESTPSVVQDEAVEVVRRHIVCCIITGISFVQRTLKKFIQLQVIHNINMDHIYLPLTVYYLQFLWSRKPRLMALGIRCADHATPSIQKGWH
jgi:hypothetical protein